MAEATIRDLRNHGGEVIDRVVAGERIIVTRDGKAVAELRPLPRQRLTATVLIERFGKLPRVDPERLRRDIDAASARTARTGRIIVRETGRCSCSRCSPTWDLRTHPPA